MLTLTGSCVIPEGHGLTVTRCNKGGAYFNFRISVQDQYNQREFHSFPCSMYVEEDYIKDWKQQIVQGAIFNITYSEPKEVKYGDGKSWTKFQLNRHKLFPIGNINQ